MSVVFLTETSVESGCKRLYRCEAIAQALSKNWVNSLILVDSTPEHTQNVTSQNHCVKWNTGKMLEIIMSYVDLSDIDAVCVDSENVTKSMTAALTALRTPIFCINENNYRDSNCIMFNLSSTAKSNNYKNFNGMLYYPLRSGLLDIEQTPYIKRNKILFYWNNDDTVQLMNILEHLQEYANDFILMTPLRPENLPTKFKVVSTKVSMDVYKNIVASVKALITYENDIIAEAAFAGVPVYSMKSIEESAELKYWSVKNFITEVHISEFFDKINNHYMWSKLSNTGRNFIDGKGAERMAGIITSCFRHESQIRADHTFDQFRAVNFINCTNQEHDMILETRNSDNVRSNSHNKNIITHDMHKIFVNALFKSTTSGFWLIYKADKPAGVISLTVDYENKAAILGYYKLQFVTTKGIGKVLVNLAVKIAFEKLGLTDVVAECYENNMASAKSLEAAGFQKTGSSNESDGTILIYEIRNIDC